MALRDGKWFTADNRRLWLFRHLERLDKTQFVEVDVIDAIPARKITTNNGGVTITIIGGEPEGTWYLKASVNTGPETLRSIHR